jgi:putative transposase
VAIDELHLLAAFRYVAMNPVKAKMVDQASDWARSSTKAHLSGKDDGLVTVRPLLDRVDDVSDFLVASPEQELEFALEKGQSNGRPLMEEGALVELE